MIQLHHGDCLDVLRTMPDASVDAIVTDPPYGLRFMGKRWDYDVPSVEIWAECLRVLKPGGHLLAFAGTRTQHRMAVRIEDAGFEIRDLVMWHYGSGFPKSLDVSKAIDRAAGAEREVVGPNPRAAQQTPKSGTAALGDFAGVGDITAPATPEVQQWAGWGTALKPATEIVTMARKPLQGTVAANVLQWGTGGINVDGCRIGSESTTTIRSGNSGANGRYGKDNRVFTRKNPPGRWPANLLHDGSDEVVGLFPKTKPSRSQDGPRGTRPAGFGNVGHVSGSNRPNGTQHDDAGGSAARFFYTAKATMADRDEGCEELEYRTAGEMVDRKDGSAEMQSPRAGAGRTGGGRNAHPTVKPVDLMCYLCRLVTPPGGIVLDPFMGSGSTGKACVTEGFSFIGIERDADSFATAQARVVSPMPLFKDVL